MTPDEFFTKLENHEKSKRDMAKFDDKFTPLDPGVAKGKIAAQITKNVMDTLI